jgi:CRP-like cAMP-binding protein
MYIQRGMVKKSVTSGAGKEAIAAVLGPGEFFGEECLAGQRHRMASVSAMTASTVLTIDRQQMLGMLHRHAALAAWFEEVLLGADESRERAAGPPIWLWPRDGKVFERPPQRKSGRSYMAKYGRKAQSKVARALHERKRGTLRSGRSGKRVTSREQAIAIGLSEARREGGRVPKPTGDRKRKRRSETSS